MKYPYNIPNLLYYVHLPDRLMELRVTLNNKVNSQGLRRCLLQLKFSPISFVQS